MSARRPASTRAPGRGKPRARRLRGDGQAPSRGPWRRYAAASAPARDGARATRTAKLAEVVAGKIQRDIIRRGWPVGEVLGSEADLLKQHRVSRALFREAVRLLEHHGIAAMRRGPGGGLVVTEPDPHAVTEAVALYLEYAGINPAHLHEARHALELEAVELLAERITDDGVRRLREALEHEEEIPDRDINLASHDVHVLIAELTGNRSLWLFVTVLTRLTQQHAVRPDPLPVPADRMADEVRSAHRRIVEAIIARDAELARRRMLRHLRAITPWLR